MACCSVLTLGSFWMCICLFTEITAQICTGDCDPNGRDCDESGICYFSCSAPASCTLAIFHCKTNSTCTVSCTMPAACNTVIIHAENAKSITVISSANAAAAALDIYCPDNGFGGKQSCFINAASNLSIEMFQSVAVYAIEGFKNVLISNCTTDRCGIMTMHGCGATYNSNKCDIDVENYAQCANNNNICERYITTNPSTVPSFEPTMEPTTAIPTEPTYTPTNNPTVYPLHPSKSNSFVHDIIYFTCIMVLFMLICVIYYICVKRIKSNEYEIYDSISMQSVQHEGAEQRNIYRNIDEVRIDGHIVVTGDSVDNIYGGNIVDVSDH